MMEPLAWILLCALGVAIVAFWAGYFIGYDHGMRSMYRAASTVFAIMVGSGRLLSREEMQELAETTKGTADVLPFRRPY